MDTVCRRIEVSDIVKRTLLDVFTTRIAHLIADATPEHARDGSLYASKENVVFALIHKHVMEFCAEWMLEEESGLDLLDECVPRLFGVADKLGPHMKEPRQALEAAWTGAMNAARDALADAAGGAGM
ncbi:hypothetical protein [Polaromonas sp. C04]|uniref:hypothetical protein n=1 Tax=Polaromonas sp. C04 TaxID=1945857 RepID=UPI000984E4DF|nr:hypothetical protein [Polaromonas sp. C04]OOG53139.1 hypothetical protein B0E49_11720 [Polaromonas sp. C04]